MHGLLEESHMILSYALGALVLVHIVGALRHHCRQAQRRPAAHVVRHEAHVIAHDAGSCMNSRSALLCAASALPAQAQDDVAAFYKGKTVRLIVGVGVGSGYDINARLLARYLPKHIPGNPTVIVQNQPGAGSLTMTNPLYAGGPFDGTAIGASFNGLPTTPLLQPTGVRFEATKLNWIGSTNRETQAMYVWHTAPLQTLDDLKTKEMIVGAQAPGSTQYDYPVLARGAVRLEVQGHHRLRGDAEDPSGDGARRGARHLGQLVDAEGDRRALAEGQEDPHPGAVGAAQASGDAGRADDPRSGQDRGAEAGAEARAGAAGVRPAVLHAAERRRRSASTPCAAPSMPP